MKEQQPKKHSNENTCKGPWLQNVIFLYFKFFLYHVFTVFIVGVLLILFYRTHSTTNITLKFIFTFNVVKFCILLCKNVRRFFTLHNDHSR